MDSDLIPFEDEVVSNDDGLVEIQRGGAAGMDEDRSAVICAFFVCCVCFCFCSWGGFLLLLRFGMHVLVIVNGFTVKKDAFVCFFCDRFLCVVFSFLIECFRYWSFTSWIL